MKKDLKHYPSRDLCDPRLTHQQRTSYTRSLLCLTIILLVFDIVRPFAQTSTRKWLPLRSVTSSENTKISVHSDVDWDKVNRTSCSFYHCSRYLHAPFTHHTDRSSWLATNPPPPRLHPLLHQLNMCPPLTPPRSLQQHHQRHDQPCHHPQTSCSPRDIAILWRCHHSQSRRTWRLWRRVCRESWRCSSRPSRLAARSAGREVLRPYQLRFVTCSNSFALHQLTPPKTPAASAYPHHAYTASKRTKPTHYGTRE